MNPVRIAEAMVEKQDTGASIGRGPVRAGLGEDVHYDCRALGESSAQCVADGVGVAERSSRSGAEADQAREPVSIERRAVVEAGR